MSYVGASGLEKHLNHLDPQAFLEAKEGVMVLGSPVRVARSQTASKSRLELQALPCSGCLRWVSLTRALCCKAEGLASMGS